MYTDLGNKIENIRTRRNIMQLDLAMYIGISRSQLSNIEKGRRAISLEQLRKVCNFFKVDLSYFLEDEKNNEYNEILNKIRTFFQNKNLTMQQKDNLFLSIMKLYIETKK